MSSLLNHPARTALSLFAFLGGFAISASSSENDPRNPVSDGDGNFVVGPDYQIDPDLTDKGNPKGKYFEFSMALADSKYFKGDDPTLEPERKPVREERKIFVYIPATYRNGDQAPVLVMHDGPSQMNLVRNALDNLSRCENKDPGFYRGFSSKWGQRWQE